MKVLVLGGSGFIGSHVVDALLAAGHGVRVYDRAPERFRSTPAGVEFRQGEFGDTASLAEALADIDMVFHLVSTTVPSTANLDPIADVQGNLINTIRLMELMRAQGGVTRLLYLSSGGTVYGVPHTDPVAETHPRTPPVTSYGIVKMAAEDYIRAEQRQHGLKPVILRPPSNPPYGPRQGHGGGVQGVIGTFMWRVARGGEGMQLWGGTDRSCVISSMCATWPSFAWPAPNRRSRAPSTRAPVRAVRSARFWTALPQSLACRSSPR